MNHTDNIEGEVTASTILKQCISMSNDNLWAFFNFSPHLSANNKVGVTVNLGNLKDESIYNYWDDENCNKTLAELLQDLIGLEYEYTEKQSAKDVK